MSKLPLWAVFLFVGIVGFGILLLVNVIQITSKPNAETQIRNAIENMREATLNNKPGGVQEHLSSALQLPTIGGQQSSNPIGDVRRFVSQAKIDKLDLEIKNIEVFGNTAIVTCNLNSDLQFLAYSGPLVITDLKIEFRKETRRRLFVLPDPTWVVVGFGAVDVKQLEF